MKLLIDGIIYGFQLSLLAIGFTLIFGLGGVLNLAHGQFAVIAGISAAVMISQGLSPFLAALLGILFTGIFGLFVERVVLLPTYKYKGETRVLFGLLLTLGLALIIDGYIKYRFPFEALALRVSKPSITMFNITIRTSGIIVALISILTLLSLLLFLRRTTLGKAIRCIIQNEAGAELCGIDITKIRIIIFVLGALLAGLVGITFGLFASLRPHMGFEFTIFAFVVTIVGGVRSIHGTIAAGILLGVVHAFSSFYIGAYLTFIIFLTTAALTILIRPSGLLGYWT